MSDCERHCDWRCSVKTLTVAVVAVAVLICFPASAEADRRGLGSSEGGATLDRGHIFWIGAGYPMFEIGWGMALHPLVDIMVHAELLYGSPNEVDDTIIGGGGGVRTRVALVRGRTSAAVTMDLSADAFGEGGGAGALLDLVSPGVELSFRVTPWISIHARMQLVLCYVTRPARFFGGFEIGTGVTIKLTRSLSFFGSASTGTSLSNADDPGAVRLDVIVGLEFRLGHR